MLYIIIILIVILIIVICGIFKIGLGLYIKSFCRAKTSEKIMALTFDDGPHPINTHRVLSVLEEYHIKACFFMIGKNVEKYPELAKLVKDSGHDIGCHTYSHNPSFTYTCKDKVKEEIQKSIDIIEKTVGFKPILFRPPYGITNPNISKIIKKLGLISIGWSIRSFDTRYDFNWSYNRVVKRYHNGGIILLHDRLDGEEILLRRIIETALKRGYKFVSISEMLKKDIYEN